MFGCGLPVAAKSCPALHELVINGINGMIFDTAEELADQVGTLGCVLPFPVPNEQSSPQI